MTGDGESVGDAAQRVDGCLPQNSAEDVLDVMDALHYECSDLAGHEEPWQE